MAIRNPFRRQNYAPASKTGFRMIRQDGDTFVGWDGNLYQSDIIRSCIRPKVKALGKTERKHLRTDYVNDTVSVNPDVYMQFLLSDPNPYMTGQKLIEKMETQLILNGNAFAVIVRDSNGLPVELYPVDCSSAEAVFAENGALSLKFMMPNGKQFLFSYDDVIHIKSDCNTDQIFGDSPAQCLTSVMNVIKTTDQGIISAIKNSAVIKWLLKFNSAMRDEDVKKKTKDFADNFLDVSNGTGVAAVDAKADAQQIENKEYVPGAETIDKQTERVYSFFNTNKNIVQSSYSEDEWNAYYESEIEPDIIAYQEEFTRKLFTRRERSFGNRIVFESTNLSTASMRTKIGLVSLVDRGILNANEVRAVFNLPAISTGNEYVLRKDTAMIGGEEDGYPD